MSGVSYVRDEGTKSAQKGGSHILVVATSQMALYCAALLGGERLDWLLYLDPRIGLNLLETVVRRDEVFPGLLSWVSAAVLGGVGIALIRSPTALKIRLWAEGVMAIPSLLFFLVVFAANLSAAHRFSIGELLLPVPVFLVASI